MNGLWTIVEAVTLLPLLAFLSWYDVRHLVLPDIGVGFVAAMGFAKSCLLGHPSILDACLGMCLGGGVLYGTSRVFCRLRGIDGLGFGDVKLAAASGLWLGWDGVPTMLLIACLSALGLIAVGAAFHRRLDRHDRIPFGPFLCLGLSGTWLSSLVG